MDPSRALHSLIRDTVKQARFGSPYGLDAEVLVKKMTDKELAQRTRALRVAKKSPPP